MNLIKRSFDEFFLPLKMCWIFLTHISYRVKIKTWGDGATKYYPQYRYRFWPWWCHFPSGQFIEVYSNEDFAWAVIEADKRRRCMNRLIKTTYKYKR